MEVPYSIPYCSSTQGYQDLHVRGALDTDNDSSLREYTYHPINIPALNVTDGYWGYGVMKYDRVTSGNNGYWTDSNYECSSYPCYVFDGNSTLNRYVNSYVSEFRASYDSNATGRLITFEELVALGCGLNGYCSNAPSWVYQTSFWSGTAASDSEIFAVISSTNFGYLKYDTTVPYGPGLRPVMEVSESIIQSS